MGWNALRGVVRNEERLLLSPVYTDDDLDLFTYHAVPHSWYSGLSGKTSDTLCIRLSNLTEKSMIGLGRRWTSRLGSTGMGTISCEGMHM